MLEISIRMDSNFIKPCTYPIELAFVCVDNFLKTKNKEIIHKIEISGLTASSIHAPHVSILDSKLNNVLYKLRALSRDLKVKNIVIHPSFANIKSKEVLGSIEQIKTILCDFNVCIERFTSKRRWVSTLEEFKYINKEFGFKCCYDYSHVPQGNEETIIDYLPFTPIIHVSNRKGENTQHQRLFDQSCNLDYTKIVKILKEYSFTGELVLEYLPAYHKYLIEDAQRLEELIYE